MTLQHKWSWMKIVAIVIGALLLSEAVLASLDQQGHNAATAAKAAAKECAPTPEAARGKELYLQNCARCHGGDGRGNTPLGKRLQASDLTDPAWQWETSDRRIAEIITNGEERMPAFGRKLSAEDVALIVAHVRTLRAKRPHTAATTHKDRRPEAPAFRRGEEGRLPPFLY